MRVMIVEDNTRMRKMLRTLVNRSVENLDMIVECSSGREAIQEYDRSHPDWTLMDIEMEPIDGLQASAAILKSHPGANIIIVTNYDDTVYRKAADAIGVRAYLLKDNLCRLSEIITQKEES